MRIIIFAFCFAFIGGLCHATEMCARNDTVVIPLDASVGVKTMGSNANEFIWWKDFENYRNYGFATCLSKTEGLGRVSGQGSIFGIGEYEKTIITAEAGLYGIDKNGEERSYCWCSMNHPVKTPWVFYYGYGGAQSCKTSCTAGNGGCALMSLKYYYNSVGIK